MHFNPRVVPEPADCLVQATPQGAVSCQMLVELEEKLENDETDVSGKYALYCFFRFLKESGKVLLQDAAAIAVLHPERFNHPLYKRLPLFGTQEWKVSWRKSFLFYFTSAILTIIVTLLFRTLLRR